MLYVIIRDSLSPVALEATAAMFRSADLLMDMASIDLTGT